MNKGHFILVFFMLFLAVNVQSQGFKKSSGKGIDIAVNPKDGTVYVIGTKKSIFKYNKSKKKFEKHIHATRAKRLSVDQNGTVYCVNSQQKVYVSEKGKWKQIPGLVSNDVDARYYSHSSSTTLKGFCTADNAKTIHEVVYGGGWRKSTLKGKEASIRVARDVTDFWTIGKSKKIRKLVSGEWKDFPGRATDIAIDDKTGKVYIVDTRREILSWSTKRNRWITLPGTRSDVVNISVYDGKVWCTTKDNSIYYYDKNARATNDEPKDYAGRYRVTVTDLYTYTKNNVLNADAQVYGTIGVRLYGKGQSGQVEINALRNKKPRLWDVSRSNPQHIKSGTAVIYSFNSGNLQKVVKYYGSYEIGKSREYIVKGELANDKLNVNVQMNLTKKDLIDEKFRFQQLNLDVKNIKFGKTYHLQALKDKERHLTIGIMVEKI